MSMEAFKKMAAHRAVEFIRSGMVIGLGHGSTTAFAIEKLAQLLQSDELSDIIAVPCSLEVEGHAARLGIPLTSLEDHPAIDLTIDGADEVDGQMNLIKGGGGALLREKVVACASQQEGRRRGLAGRTVQTVLSARALLSGRRLARRACPFAGQ